MAQPAPSRKSPATLGAVAVLLIVAIIGTLWVPIYAAYTFIAVPALVYATGAAGFYALSYTIMVFPIVFIFAPRLWSVARARGYVTPGEFVRGRHGSQGLGLAVAVTGILATMPYIALPLVGIESVLSVMGIAGHSGNS